MSVQSWPPLKKHLHNKSPFFYLKILFISLKRHLISQTKRASGYLAFTLANRLLFLSLFSEMFYPSKRIFPGNLSIILIPLKIGKLI